MRPARLLLVLACAWLAPACSAIIGLEDVPSVTEAADGTTPGDEGASSDRASDAPGPDGAAPDSTAQDATGADAIALDRGVSEGATADRADGSTASDAASEARLGDAGAPDVAADVTPEATVTYVVEPIDDMMDPLSIGILNTNGREGTWYVYDDGTAGTISTAPLGSLVPTSVTGGPNGVPYARRVQSSGFTGYGAGFGFFVNAGGAYDASRYLGVRFWAKIGAGTTAAMPITFDDHDTDPNGGVCDPGASSGPTGCNHPFAVNVVFSSSWQQYTVLFSDVGPNSDQKVFDPSAIYTIDFALGGSNAYDLSVADIAFVSAAPVDAGAPASLVIDDMSGGPSTRIRAPAGEEPGGWYAYGDGTGSLTNPAPFTPVSDAVDAGAPISRAACVSSTSPFTGYGAAMGFAFVNSADVLPDGGLPPPISFDVSAYSGVTFWAVDRSNGAGAKTVNVSFPDSNSTPTAGLCVAPDGGTQGCFDSFAKAISLSATWQSYTIPFSQLKQAGFGYPSTTGMLDKQHVYNMNFGIQGPNSADGGGPGVTFDFCVSDISFTP